MRARLLVMLAVVLGLATWAWWWAAAGVVEPVDPRGAAPPGLPVPDPRPAASLAEVDDAPAPEPLLPGGLDADAVAAGRARARLPTRPLILRVIDTAGEPVPGVDFEFLARDERGGPAQVVARGATHDVDGEALLVLRVPVDCEQVRVTTPGWWLFGLRVGGLLVGMPDTSESRADARLLIELPALDDVELVLAASLAYRVEVVDAQDGRPVSSARVEVVADAEGMPFPYVRDVRRVRASDAHGRVELSFRATGWAGLDVTVTAPGFVDRGPARRELDAAARVVHDVVALERAEQLVYASGRVTRGGVAIAGESVQLAVVEAASDGAANSLGLRPLWHGRADDDGRFAFHAVRGADDERVLVGTSQRGSRSAFLGPFGWRELDGAELALRLPDASRYVTLRVRGARAGQRVAYGTAWVLDGRLLDPRDTGWRTAHGELLELNVGVPRRDGVGLWVSPSARPDVRGDHVILDGRAPPPLVDLRLAPSFVLAGRVTVPSPSERVRVLSVGALRAEVRGDGRFRLVGVPAGRLVLVLADGAGDQRAVGGQLVRGLLGSWTVDVIADDLALQLDAGNADG